MYKTQRRKKVEITVKDKHR